jgi:hypothetical protein
LKKRWVTKVGTGRAVKVTPSGAKALHELLGLTENQWSDG